MKHEITSTKINPTRDEALASNGDQLKEIAHSLLVASGLAVDQCHAMAEKLHAELRERWGGRRVYFHKIGIEEARARREYVISHWNGRNTEDVIRATGYSLRRIYQIAAAANEARAKKNL